MINSLRQQGHFSRPEDRTHESSQASDVGLKHDGFDSDRVFHQALGDDAPTIDEQPSNSGDPNAWGCPGRQVLLYSQAQRT
jgi:hypothetical protein